MAMEPAVLMIGGDDLCGVLVLSEAMVARRWTDKSGDPLNFAGTPTLCE